MATGRDEAQNGHSRAFIETLLGGSWTAVWAPLPAGAAPSSATTTAGAYLNSVTCPAAGSCVAVGMYTERGSSNTAVLIDTLSGGTWTAATAPLPADASADGQSAGLSGISCQTPGNCVAIGSYIGRGGARFLAETLSAGTWTAAAPPLPADARAPQKGLTILDSLACQEVGHCVAVGSYQASSGAIDGAIDTLSGRAWTAAAHPAPGAATTSQLVLISQVVCPAPGYCIGVGRYHPEAAKDGNGQALIETATGKHG